MDFVVNQIDHKCFKLLYYFICISLSNVANKNNNNCFHYNSLLFMLYSVYVSLSLPPSLSLSLTPHPSLHFPINFVFLARLTCRSPLLARHKLFSPRFVIFSCRVPFWDPRLTHGGCLLADRSKIIFLVVVLLNNEIIKFYYNEFGRSSNIFTKFYC